MPAVEDGTVTLIGATTENPSFEVNAALLSRARVLSLRPLAEADVAGLLRRALADPGARAGAPSGPRSLTSDLDRLAAASGGDARVALSALESAVLATAPGGRRRPSRRPGVAGGGGRPRPVRLRQGGRGALQSRLGPDQKFAELRRRRRALLARPPGRGRRRPGLRRPPALHPGVRGRRACRPPGDGPGRRRCAGRPARRPARGALPARAGRHLPGPGAQVERREAGLFCRGRGRRRHRPRARPPPPPERRHRS